VWLNQVWLYLRELGEAAEDVVGMALQIYLAHTGQRLQADPGQFTS
jgi:hypothetical protein